MKQQTMILYLLHLKPSITCLKALDQRTLTEAERHAVSDSLAQTYARAEYFITTLSYDWKETSEREIRR